MIFDAPKLEDLNFEFSLENAGCVITVRKYKEFNDDAAKKLFPRSSADYIPSDTYSLPDSYFCKSFWITEKKRLQEIRDVWISNKNKLAAVARAKGEDDLQVVNCMTDVVTIIDMCEWMLAMCWEGDRSKPPMPLYLYRARINELKDACLLGIRTLQNLSCSEKNEVDVHTDIIRLNKQNPPWKVRYIEHIGRISSTLDEFSNAGEDVKDALTNLKLVQQCLNDARSCRRDISNKFKVLNEELTLLEKKIDERSRMMRTSNVEIPTSSPPTGFLDAKDNSNEAVQISNRGCRNFANRRGRKSTKAVEDDNNSKKRNLGLILNDSDDDLISRVKRGQRTRRPARTFTPLWTLSSSPPPANKTAPSSKPATSMAKILPPLIKRTLPHATPLTPTMCSPDSGRPSSNESDGNGVALAKDVALHSADTVDLEKSEQPLSAQPSIPSCNTSLATTTTSTSPIISAYNYSTPLSSVSATKTYKPPPLTLDEQSVLALWKEKIQLGDVRITLLNMLTTEATSQYHFIPLMVETIDKATAALDNKDMIAFAMHKAAIEVGCTELGNIMRSSNPIDPASQIASLATAMGLNPAPFASMIQPSHMTTGFNNNLLVDLHEAAAVVAASEKLTSSYSLPTQTVDPVQVYTERDMPNYIL